MGPEMSAAVPQGGCPQLQQWADGLHYTLDSRGREELVDATGSSVMLESDRPEVEKTVEELLLAPGCSVLELGFGCGYSAELIQGKRPASHVIVECAPAVLQRLHAWAKGRPGVTVVEGTWQSRLPELGTFDRIFFDAGLNVDLDSREMERCPHHWYREAYSQVMRRPGATVFDAFETLARARHSNPETLISSGAGSEFRQWTDGFFFSLDRDGKEQLLDCDGVQVMMEWERPYMLECVVALGVDSSCDVLEVGFGCGFSASCIQRAGPRSHTIIECSEAVLQRLRAWAADKPSVRIVQGTWQSRLPELGLFDCLFFDDYGMPGRAEDEMARCPKAEYREEYSATMRQDGGSHFEAFLNIAMRWHARQGSRLSGFVLHPLRELEEFDGVEAHYRHVEVAPPAHCNYFFSNRAVVPLFIKKSPPPWARERSTSLGSHSDGKRARSLSSERSSGQGCPWIPLPPSSPRRSSSRSRSRSRSRGETQPLGQALGHSERGGWPPHAATPSCEPLA